MTMEHPLLCNSEAVRNISAGRQTQDRRPIKSQPTRYICEDTGDERWKWQRKNEWGTWAIDLIPRSHAKEFLLNYGPYGKPGDVLWVRETWGDRNTPRGDLNGLLVRLDQYKDVHYIEYAADVDTTLPHNQGCWKPSIHMPKWACRLYLTVKRVWVERIQDISEADAKAEGAEPENAAVNIMGKGAYVNGFFDLWNSTYGPDAWDRNDWVFATEFAKQEFPGQ